jgi:hypothetical protein
MLSRSPPLAGCVRACVCAWSACLRPPLQAFPPPIAPGRERQTPVLARDFQLLRSSHHHRSVSVRTATPYHSALPSPRPCHCDHRRRHYLRVAAALRLSTPTISKPSLVALLIFFLIFYSVHRPSALCAASLRLDTASAQFQPLLSVTLSR